MNKAVRILNLEPLHYSANAQAVLETLGDVTNGPLSRNELLEKIGVFDVLVTRLGHQIDKEALNAANSLKVIVSATTGLNHIDMEVAQDKKITILSLQGEREFLDSIHATAEHSFALIFSLYRKIPSAHQSVMNGHWDRDSFIGNELQGKKLGIIGLGRLGTKVANFAKAFDITVYAYDTNPAVSMDGIENTSSLNEIADLCDIITIHIPSSKENKNFIASDFFNRMKRNAILINTSRGDVVDQVALLSSLKDKKIAAAALDVLEEEYNGNLGTSPLIEYARNHENLIITPHIGGATYESMHKTELFMAQKLQRFFLSQA
ncbi:MAG: hydroxyacid dehydrogenase [Micavibrio aeruginosavorus]|uniref:Hydroxyacid dehydrogenase n=1 Tax=Micavibrio aeruginosavorus TaxID=349221 RepID=A0A2W5FJC9_9BACT|nr:MAG: hydroxyacid dehydrogenase [Micavibrio aeruginosavorus]